MSTRERRLSQRHRTVLFLVDGRRNVAEVQRMAMAAGASELLLDELLALGLLILQEPVEGASSVWSTLPEPQELPAPSARPDIPLNDSLLPPLAPLSVHSVQSTAQLPPNLPVLQAVMEGHTTLQAPAPDAILESGDPLNEARDMLIRAVREESPVTGSLTVLRLKRAKSIADVTALLGEVEQRINKPNRNLVTQQLLSNVKQLLILASSR